MIPHLNISVERSDIATAILRKEAQRGENFLIIDRGLPGFFFIACGSVDDASAIQQRWAKTGTLPYGIATIEVMLSGKLMVVRQYGVESQKRLSGFLTPFIEKLRTLTKVYLIDDDTGIDVSDARYAVLFGETDLEDV